MAEKKKTNKKSTKKSSKKTEKVEQPKQEFDFDSFEESEKSDSK